MHRFYIPTALESNITLCDDHYHYVCNVLRLKNGDCIVLFNADQGEYLYEITALNKKSCQARQKEKLRDPHVCAPLALAFGLIKPERLQFIFEKGTELGVTDFYPLHTAFTQHTQKKLHKASDYMRSATQQCERSDMPLCHAPHSLDTFIHAFSKKWCLYAALERNASLSSACAKKHTPSRPPCLIVGPEGGWSGPEKFLLETIEDVTPLSLGALILRTETAAIKGLSILSADT